MEISVRPGDSLYAADGQRLGQVDDARLGRDGRVYLHIHRRLRSDYWIARDWIKQRDGDAKLILDFGKSVLDRFKRSRPA